MKYNIMGKQFNLEDWIKNRSRKVITRDGKPVRIVCWDSPNKAFPIVGFIDDNPTVFVWDNYGYSKAGHVESKCDLFFAEEEEKLTEFEKEYKKLYMEGYADGQAGSKPLSEKALKECATELLNLARKEI